MYASYDCPVGNGVLTYDASTTTATFRAYGEAAGDAVDITAPTRTAVAGGLAGDDERFFLFSNGGSSIRVIAVIADLPSSGVHQWTVKVTHYGITDPIAIYPDMLKDPPTGRWEGESASTPSDTEGPLTPDNFAGAAGGSAGEIDWSWDQTTDVIGTVTGYNLYYRNNTQNPTGSFTLLQFVPDSATPGITQTGLTEGETYEAYVIAYDNSGNPSTASAHATSVPSSGVTYDLSNTEFNDTSAWTPMRSVNFTSTDGIGKLTNTIADNGYIKQSFTVSEGDTLISYSYMVRGLYAGGTIRVVLGAENTYTGSIATHQDVYVENYPNWLVKERSVAAPSPGTYWVMLWVNSNTIGDWDEIEYFRLTVS